MHIEIAQAVEFLGRLLQSKVDQDTINAFKEKLTELLKIRFQDHWDPQQPYKGNGYRAISNFNGQLDPILTLGKKIVFFPILICFVLCLLNINNSLCCSAHSTFLYSCSSSS